MTNGLTVGDLPDGLVELLLETSMQDAAAAALVASFRRPPIRRPDLEYRCQAGGCTLLAVYVMPNALVCRQAGVRLSAAHSQKVQGVPRGSAEGAAQTDAKLVIPERSFCIAPTDTDTDTAPGGGWLAPDGPVLLVCKHQHGAIHARRVRAHLADPPADRLLLLKPRER